MADSVHNSTNLTYRLDFFTTLMVPFLFLTLLKQGFWVSQLVF